MYVNLILGGIAVVVLWLYLRKMLVRDDVLREDPAALLEKEVSRRRVREEDAARAFERIRDAGRDRMRPVAAALAAIQAALPRMAEAPQKTLRWDDEGDAIVIRMRGEDAGDASLAVSWRVPDLDLQRAARLGGELPGVFILKRSDSGQEEQIENIDACVRRITSFIVDFMA